MFSSNKIYKRAVFFSSRKTVAAFIISCGLFFAAAPLLAQTATYSNINTVTTSYQASPFIVAAINDAPVIGGDIAMPIYQQKMPLVAFLTKNSTHALQLKYAAKPSEQLVLEVKGLAKNAPITFDVEVRNGTQVLAVFKAAELIANKGIICNLAEKLADGQVFDNIQIVAHETASSEPADYNIELRVVLKS